MFFTSAFDELNILTEDSMGEQMDISLIKIVTPLYFN